VRVAGRRQTGEATVNEGRIRILKWLTKWRMKAGPGRAGTQAYRVLSHKFWDRYGFFSNFVLGLAISDI
jgi:hypothetical protein